MRGTLGAPCIWHGRWITHAVLMPSSCRWHPHSGQDGECARATHRLGVRLAELGSLPLSLSDTAAQRYSLESSSCYQILALSHPVFCLSLAFSLLTSFILFSLLYISLTSLSFFLISLSHSLSPSLSPSLTLSSSLFSPSSFPLSILPPHNHHPSSLPCPLIMGQALAFHHCNYWPTPHPDDSLLWINTLLVTCSHYSDACAHYIILMLS